MSPSDPTTPAPQDCFQRGTVGTGPVTSILPEARSHTKEAGRDITLRPGAKALLAGPDGTVLLIQERRTDGSTFWTLPGGGIEAGETPEACLHRELREELDCGVSVGSPFAVCSYSHTSQPDTRSRYAVFYCSVRSEPTPVREEGIVSVRRVVPSSPPEGTLAPFRVLLETLVEDESPGPSDGIGRPARVARDR